MNRGVTLTELMLALAVLGVLLAIGISGLKVPLDSFAVDRAAHEVAAAHQRARMAAVLTNRTAELLVSAESLVIRLTPALDTGSYWQQPGPAQHRVALSGPTRPFRFRPAGISYGFSNGTYSLTRGSARRDVIVSRLGRVRIVRRRRRRIAKPPAQTAPVGGAAGPGARPPGRAAAAQRRPRS